MLLLTGEMYAIFSQTRIYSTFVAGEMYAMFSQTRIYSAFVAGDLYAIFSRFVLQLNAKSLIHRHGPTSFWMVNPTASHARYLIQKRED